MRIGFTGSRWGMSLKQRNVVEDILNERCCTRLHHGDCIGADKEAHQIAHDLEYLIEIHPPDNPAHRALCTGKNVLKIHKPLPYLKRNRAIVNAVDLLIVVPSNFVEKNRSGTWATYRYGRAAKKIVILILPNGITKEFKD